MQVTARIAIAGLALAGLGLVATAGARAQDTPPPTEPPADEGATEGEAAAEPSAPPREPFAGNAADLAAAHAHVSVTSIGRSEGGRDLPLIAVGDENADWAALVVAGLHGRRDRDESRLALDVAAWLAEHVDELPPRTLFFVLADGNPDATAAAFPRAGNDRPVDDDADGDVDEDGPDDVNGDGVISWMRFPDPTGAWSLGENGRPVRAHPARGLARTHRIVPEGRDDDRDGVWNEDGPGGVDISRNFTWAFEEHVAPAGRWPASESETRAIMDLILADERIALVYELGGAESVVGTPGWNDAWKRVPDDDAALLDGLREMHGAGVDTQEDRQSHAPGSGSLGGVIWHQLGRLWLGRAPLGRQGPVWPDGDTELPAALHVTWTAIEGEGLPPGAEIATITRDEADAPGPAVTDETPSIGAFLRDAAAARARLSFVATVASGGSGVLRLRTRLVNTGRLPTHTARGAELRARRPLNVRVVLPAGASLEGGRPLVQIERLAAGGTSDELAWVVAGSSGDTVRIEATGPDTGTVVHEERIP